MKTKTLTSFEHARLILASVIIALFIWTAVLAHASGPVQKKIVINVPQPETNYWPAVIGAISVLGAAAIGVRRKVKKG